MRPTSPVALLLVLLVPLVACGGDSDDDGTVDTGADVPQFPLEGQWEGTLTSPDADPIEVWVHFDLESGGAIGLPCEYDEVVVGRSIGSDTGWTMQLRYRGTTVIDASSGRYLGDRQEVAFNGQSDCFGAIWTGEIRP